MYIYKYPMLAIVSADGLRVLYLFRSTDDVCVDRDTEIVELNYCILY